MKLPEKWQQVEEQNDEHIVKKIPSENEKCVTYFHLKTERICWPIQHSEFQALLLTVVTYE